LVESVVWCKDASFNIDSIDGDGSSRSLDVVDDSFCGSRESSSSQEDVVSSWDIDDPSGIGITVIQNNISVLGHLSRGDGNIVVQRISVVASDGKSRPLDQFSDVISSGSKVVLVCSIASSNIIEFSADASRSSTSSGNSVVQVAGSSEGSSDEHVLGPVGSVGINFVMWVDFSRSPVNISSGNESIRKDLVSSGFSS